MDSGQWTVDSGQWTVDSGQWTVDSGQWTIMCVARLVDKALSLDLSTENNVPLSTIHNIIL